jgi:probable rRNA maturation factor
VPIAFLIEKGPHEGLARAELVRRVRAMIALLQLNKAEVSFVLTDDVHIHQLNKIYRHKDRPTDVLAFAMHEGEFGALAGHLLGDVIVSVETARKQAQARRRPVLEEVTMLLAHGLLHLLGWDHRTDAEDRRMRAETSRLCAAAAQPGSRKAVSKGGAKRGLSRKPSRPRAVDQRKKPQ